MSQAQSASPVWLRVLVLLAAVVPLRAGQQAKAEATASGVFLGRSGKPMAKARVFLGQVLGDEVLLYAKIKLVDKPPAALTDDQGRFQFKGFTPGTYTVVYVPAGVSVFPPAEINIKALSAVTKSILPLMRDVEVGTTGEPFAQRAWGREFTLLKGHTFYAEGANMKPWNATIRRGPQGPYIEMRRGVVWQSRFNDKSQIKLEAWSF